VPEVGHMHRLFHSELMPVRDFDFV
jgi:hypothetical protein